jgi:4-amino-4-deoxy-L-arabinose transferase-like glycosyltransferase
MEKNQEKNPFARDVGQAWELLAIALVGVALFALMLREAETVGVTWDEPFYVQAAMAYTGLISADDLRAQRIDSPWRLNHEHPPLGKMLLGAGEYFAIIWQPQRADAVLRGARGVNVLLFLLTLLAVWLLARPLDWTGRMGAVLFCLGLPRLLGHATLATLDLPLTCFWLWTMLAFFRAEETKLPEERWGWRLAAGVLFGCAFLTKFSAVVLLPALGAWIALGALAKKENRLREAANGFASLAAVAAAGAAMLFACWPWLWEDTFPRLQAYFAAQFNHNMAPVTYLGNIYGATFGTDAPPWHYVPVMLALTTPAPVILGAMLSAVFILPGFFRAKKTDGKLERQARLAQLAVLGALALPLSSLASGGLAYDGVRLFLPTLPLLAVAAACGWSRLLQLLGDRIKTEWKYAAPLIMLPLAGASCWLGNSGDDRLSSYAALPGLTADRLGMDQCYWATALRREQARELTRFVNREIPGRKRVRLIGFGSVAPGFMQGFGWFDQDWDLSNGDDWNACVVLDRRSYKAAKEFLAEAESSGLQPRKVFSDTTPAARQVWVFIR